MCLEQIDKSDRGLWWCLVQLGAANNMTLVHRTHWPDFLTARNRYHLHWLSIMENSLKTVPEEDLLTIIDGEVTEARTLVEKHRLQLVDFFLGQAFDGLLTEIFYEPPASFSREPALKYESIRRLIQPFFNSANTASHY